MSSLYIALLAASCVPANSAFRAVPGLRGPDVTVAIDPLPSGQFAPRLSTTPLAPVAFDIASLPALDAVTNPAILTLDPATAGMTPYPEGAVPPPQVAAPMMPPPDFSRSVLTPGPAVQPYAFRSSSALDAMRAQQCLTAAIYYEAASESEDGQRGVAQVVLNRVRHPAYPNTVCDVVYQGTERGDKLCQFSFACDGSISRLPSRTGWERASRVARGALAGYVFPQVGTATHYHTLAVNPYWNKSLVATAIIGAHIFYRWGSKAGLPGAFYSAYRGGEPTPGPRAHPIRPTYSPYNSPYAGGTAYPSTSPMIGTPKSAIGIGTGQQTYAPADASVAAIQARSQQEILAQQATLAKAARQMAPVRPVAEDNRYVAGSLPESDVRPEFSNSGQWIKRQ